MTRKIFEVNNHFVIAETEGLSYWCDDRDFEINNRDGMLKFCKEAVDRFITNQNDYSSFINIKFEPTTIVNCLDFDRIYLSEKYFDEDIDGEREPSKKYKNDGMVEDGMVYSRPYAYEVTLITLVVYTKEEFDDLDEDEKEEEE